ncbi:uncharacterized protein PHALS_07029 [Plasmopara halstedii]|uniref:Uncharacterized protein n=1 Tax=Plasmopara halstedii TaxID=4781 RepID=A0A0P1B4G3_PLAHL|nr:uncharacterized protein PHALS_07029 [Plasmopara halstedii]CEG49257.1 hypothetical protein PHALS_07029 [Plasmopara halstedii]|eukprot:XP_024585626.1 hypothetical protein PHALS_07029 [Plasmopara halstedii]
MDHLHKELVTLPSLAHLSASQLRDLKWTVKELVLITLFQEQVSSNAVAQELQIKSKDRKLERKADKLLGDVDRVAIRKKEDKYRAEFMQLVASELARLGAPALITWQKLVFDKECCAQAFRLLLTRIKSSCRSAGRKVSTYSSSPNIARYAARQSQCDSNYCGLENDSGDTEDAYADSDDFESCAKVPSLIPSQDLTKGMKEYSLIDRCTSNSKNKGQNWNFDSTIEPLSRKDESQCLDSRGPTRKRISVHQTSRPRTDGGIMIERTVSSKQPSDFVSKFRKDEARIWQEEKLVLTNDNAKLRDEIKHLESLLQNDSSSNSMCGDSLEVAQKRIRLLQAQKVQLQRQVSLLQKAMEAFENSEVKLMSAMESWRKVIEDGMKQAKAAGADQNATAMRIDDDEITCRQPIKWMLAVPEKLMHEFKRVESQIKGATLAANACLETKLRVSKLSMSFVRNEAMGLKMSEIYNEDTSCIAHLRIERVQQLENDLESVSTQLDELSAQVLQIDFPKISLARPLRSYAYELMKSVQKLLLEVGAFGVVVPTSTTLATNDAATLNTKDCHSLNTIMEVLSSTGGIKNRQGNAKEREKRVMLMLKQLQARQNATEHDLVACRKIADYWRTAWNTQGEILRKLAKSVQSLGQKKVKWCQNYLLTPMINLSDVFTSFQQAYDKDTTRQNPYLPLLIETLNMVHPILQNALEQWQNYSNEMQDKMDALYADYEANYLVLVSSSGN